MAKTVTATPRASCDCLVRLVTVPLWFLLVQALFLTPSLYIIWRRQVESWRRHLFSSVKHVISLWVQAVTLDFCLHDAVRRLVLTPSPSLDLVTFRFSWDFFIFRTFSLQKRPKALLFWFPLQKHLKWQKKRLWVKSNHKMHELGLKLTPKNITFFVSSNTLTLEICLSPSKCAFILIKIQVRGHLMRT